MGCDFLLCAEVNRELQQLPAESAALHPQRNTPLQEENSKLEGLRDEVTACGSATHTCSSSWHSCRASGRGMVLVGG